MSRARRTLVLDGASLGAEALARVARDPSARVVLDKRAMKRVAAGRAQIEAIVERYREDHRAFTRDPVRQPPPVQDYGVTTGYGEFKDIPLPPETLEAVQQRLLLSHAVGAGASSHEDDPASYFPPEVIRATLVVRINAFLQGHSGVRPELVLLLVDLLHQGIVPLVPIRGSLGSSGDLCPLAHLFAILLGEGRYRRIQTAAEMGPWSTPQPASALAADLGRGVLVPSVKEGLALTNGATVSTALLALAVADASALTQAADLSAALTLEALCGCARAFDPKVHAARGQHGQIASAARIRVLVEGSSLVDAAEAVQDPYSLRCAPAVHGATRDALDHVRAVVERELNAATDNPLFFPGDRGEPWDHRFRENWPVCYDGAARSSYSAGNFHGQPIALAADLLAMAVAELGSIAERRTQLLLDRHHNRNLPANLVVRRGVNSGYMIAQYAAASLVMENRVLSHPASVDSIPTAANIEDHVAGATVAARKARTVLGNVASVLAIELVTAAQAIDWRAGMGWTPDRRAVPPLGAREAWDLATAEAEDFAHATADGQRESIAVKLGRGTAAAYRTLRHVVPPLGDDRLLEPEMRAVRRMLEDGSLLAAVARATPDSPPA